MNKLTLSLLLLILILNRSIVFTMELNLDNSQDKTQKETFYFLSEYDNETIEIPKELINKSDILQKMTIKHECFPESEAIILPASAKVIKVIIDFYTVLMPTRLELLVFYRALINSLNFKELQEFYEIISYLNLNSYFFIYTILDNLYFKDLFAENHDKYDHSFIESKIKLWRNDQLKIELAKTYLLSYLNPTKRKHFLNIGIPYGFSIKELLWQLKLSKSSNLLNSLHINSLDGLYELLKSKKFKELTDLHLADNSIREIEPDIFNRLKQIKKLNLADNMIQKLTNDTFRGLRNLNYLTLSNNNLKILEQNCFSNLHNLKAINLSGNKIDELNSKIFRKLKRLEYLDISNNNINKLDYNIFKGLKILKQLYLNNNEIDKIESQVFKNLENLKSLNLSNNRISDLKPSIFTGLTQLKKLNLSHNRLTSLIGHPLKFLTNLKSLRLNNNKIYRIDESHILNNLNYLNLRNTKIKDRKFLTSLVKNKDIKLKLNKKRLIDLEGTFENKLYKLYLNQNYKNLQQPESFEKNRLYGLKKYQNLNRENSQQDQQSIWSKLPLHRDTRDYYNVEDDYHL